MVEKALPSVVNIAVWSADPAETGVAGKSPAHDHRIFGSGLIVGADGTILTNRHVIQGAETISVVLQDQSRLPARVIGVAELVDLALLKVDAGRPLPVLQFADSDQLRVGDPVVAIGNPLGVGTSVTGGLVSAINRNIMDTPFDDFVQTDAAINHGNSGGPLIDMAGRVIGINTLLRAPVGSTGSVGIGFAIPSNDVAFVVSRLLGPGSKTPGWIGVRLQDTTPEMAEALGMRAARGAVVTAVVANGPAAHAGLKPGDIIVATADQEQVDARSVLRAAARADIGDALDLRVWSRGAERTVPVSVALWPAMPHDAAADPDQSKVPEPPGLGIGLAPLTPALRKRYALPPELSGVAVVSVDERSEARDRGFGPGDVVEQVQLSPVTTIPEVDAALGRARQDGRDFVLLLVRRKDGASKKAGPTWIPLALGPVRRPAATPPPPRPAGP